MRTIEQNGSGLSGAKRDTTRFWRRAAKAVWLLFVFYLLSSLMSLFFIYMTYASNPYMFDALTRVGSWFGYSDAETESYAVIRIGMSESEVKRIAGAFPAGQREYSKDGKLCRETYWDEGAGPLKKAAPVCAPETRCITHRIQWSLADPPPRQKEYQDYKIDFINGRVVKKTAIIERVK